MLFSLNLYEIFPLVIINTFFFFIFSSVLLLSYPTGRYFLRNYYERNLIKNCIFSITIFAAVISIFLNLAPIISKYIIFIFYLANLIILVINSKIRNDFIRAIISFKFVLLITFLIFLIISSIFKYIDIKDSQLLYFFDTHDTYFWDPIYEIFTADYFSRVKISSLYPAEWSTYHFFSASFNSIFLSPIYKSGTIGLLNLKNFYVSIFFSLFFISFLNKENFEKEKYAKIILKSFLIVLFFILLFFPKIIWLIQSNGFVSAISVIFIVQSILSKNKNDFLIWAIILSLSAFRNGFISLMLVIYFFIDSQNINFNTFFDKIKKSLNLPNILLATLFLIYSFATFYQSEFSLHHPKYSIPSDRAWWLLTTSNHILQSYQSVILIFILLIIAYVILLKFFIKEKISISPKFKKINFLYFISVLVIPFGCALLLIFKNQLIDLYNVKKLEIFFDYFNLTNLYYFFFIPLIWCLFLICARALDRYIFIFTIVIYTFLSIFIYNAITLPAFFIVELIILFLVSRILFKFDSTNRKMVFSYLFISSVVISSIFNTDLYLESIKSYKYRDAITFEIKEIKELNKKRYFCPQDIKHINANDYSAALSAILAKPYYTHLNIISTRRNPEIGSLDFAISPKKSEVNPCSNS